MRIVHLVYAGLGGHTSVFFAHEKFAPQYGIELCVCLYGIEQPLKSTIEALEQRKIPYVFVKKKKGIDLSFVRKISKSIFRFNPDIVFLHSAQALPGLKFKNLFRKGSSNVKFIVRETQALNLKTQRQKILSALSLVIADAMVFLSDDYRIKFFAEAQWKQRYFSKTKVILNGLDTDYFSPARKKDITEPFVRIGMISRLVPIKDHKTLIDAVVQLKNFGCEIELHIAGDGSTFDEIQQYIILKEASQLVIMHGLISGGRVLEFLQNLDIYVHSSFGETMSNSIMQAQSCGLPIVATDVFGINNVIKNGENGFLFSLGNIEQLVEILIKMLSDSEMRENYGRLSRAYAIEHLSDKKMFEEYYELFIK